MPFPLKFSIEDEVNVEVNKIGRDSYDFYLTYKR